MVKQTLSICFVVLNIATVTATPAHAWCFVGKACATDDSVCDMGTNTTEHLGYRTFVRGNAPREVEIYERLAYREIIGHCQNGQLLILHSDGSLDFDTSILSDVAKRFCVVASIERTPVHSRQELTGRDLTGFELRCPISKMIQFREEYKAMEAKESTAQLVAEANKLPETGPPRHIDLFSFGRRMKDPECAKAGPAVLYGGGGRCGDK